MIYYISTKMASERMLESKKQLQKYIIQSAIMNKCINSQSFTQPPLSHILMHDNQIIHQENKKP